MRAVTYAERPDLAARTGEIEDTFAPFLGHGEVALRHWHKLRPDFPEFQLVLWDDEQDVVVGHARTLPTRAAEGLPDGVDGVLEAWFEGGPEDDRIVLLKVRAQRIHAWAGGEELVVEPGAGIKRIES